MIYISIVSHGHSNLIIENKELCSLLESDDIKIVIKNNCLDKTLIDFCADKKVYLIDHNYGLGFGENNNLVFLFCEKSLGMTQNDFFMVVNPDVYIKEKQIKLLAKKMRENKAFISAINLFKNKELSQPDFSIRKFPSFFSFAKSFAFKENDTILDKSIIHVPVSVDWAAGSFLAFNAGYYRSLGGFDEKYFMYCEDIDICYRSSREGKHIIYYPDITAIHLARHANRQLLSKHFFWHIKSAIRFLLTKKGLTKPKTSI